MASDFSNLTPEQLDKMDKRALIAIISSLQGQLNAVSNQLNFLTEQIVLMNQRSFGRKTEKIDQMSHQMSLFEMYDIFNEAEAASDDSKEPDIKEVVISGHTRKVKTKREDKLEGLPSRIFEYKLNEEVLSDLFPGGYKELPPETYKRLSVIPQQFMVDEYHIHVYASKNNDGTIIKAERPADLFRNSLATPSLLSLIINNKFANHLPVERQVKEMKYCGVNLGTNTVSNWMIKASEYYLSHIYDELHSQLLKGSDVIHADETPFEVIQDGRSAGSKSYMWVYRNGACDSKKPIILFDYQPTRRLDHPEEFLANYNGVVVTDGYQVYHSLEKKREGLMVAGCWVHAKRKFAELVKSIGPDKADGVIAAEATKKISSIFHEDNKLDGLSKSERKKQRQRTIKPLVDEFFAWAKEAVLKVPDESATGRGLQYCINQEQFLRVFLKNGDVPMDNNLAEQAIRPFTLGRKNWVCIATPKGAKASAILYSLVETAKANNLRLLDYFEYLLSEMAKHSKDKDLSYIQDLLPWSKKIQKEFRIGSKTKKSIINIQ